MQQPEEGWSTSSVLCRAGFVISSFVITVSASASLVFLIQPQAEEKVAHSLAQKTWVSVLTWIRCKMSIALPSDYLDQMLSGTGNLIHPNSKHCHLAKTKCCQTVFNEELRPSSGRGMDTAQLPGKATSPCVCMSAAPGCWWCFQGSSACKQHRNACSTHYNGAHCIILLNKYLLLITAKCQRKQTNKNQQRSLESNDCEKDILGLWRLNSMKVKRVF